MAANRKAAGRANVRAACKDFCHHKCKRPGKFKRAVIRACRRGRLEFEHGVEILREAGVAHD